MRTAPRGPFPQSRPRSPSSEPCSRPLGCWEPRPAGALVRRRPRGGITSQLQAPPPGPGGCGAPQTARVRVWPPSRPRARLSQGDALAAAATARTAAASPPGEQRSSHRVARGFSGRIPLGHPTAGEPRTRRLEPRTRRRTPRPPAAQAQPGALQGPAAEAGRRVLRISASTPHTPDTLFPLGGATVRCCLCVRPSHEETPEKPRVLAAAETFLMDAPNRIWGLAALH